ncbi:MAG: VanZ family protein [Gemmatimonadota bacterium]
MRRWLVAWGPAAAWAAFLFLVSSRATVPLDLSSGLDKVAHFCAYLVLGWLLAHGSAHVAATPVVAVALGCLYGALDELHQSTVPGRTAEFGDWIADALGTAAGVLLFLYVWRKRDSRADFAPGTTAEGTKHHD